MTDSIFDIEFNPNKVLVHWDRLQELLKNGDTSPVTLELDVSSGCNHACRWCVDPPGTHSNRMMPVPMARGILEEAHGLGVKGVVFKGGGESTLHPGFPEILQPAAGFGFEIGVVTHGGFLKDKTLLEALSRYCAYVRISIDGPNPRARKDIHGVNDFSRLIEGTEKLMALRGSKRHPVVGGTFCLDYQRRALAEECILLGERLGLDYVLIRPPFCEEVGFPAPYTPAQAAELRKTIRETAGAYTGNLPVMAGDWVGDKEMEQLPPSKTTGGMARRDSAIRPRQYNGIEHITKRCPASPLFLVVTAEGDVYGCCCLRGIKEFSFGRIDVDKGKTLTEIMKSNQRQQALSRMKQTECLQYCTHPMAKINQILEYLGQPEKFHSAFL